MGCYQILLVVTLLQIADVVHSQSVDKDLSKSILDFTVLFSRFHYKPDVVIRRSLVWSPLSLYQAMFMVGEGANGTTFEEIERITHLKTKDNYRQWSQHFLKDTEKYLKDNTRFNTSMKVANRLYADNNFQLNKKFNKVLTEYYLSTLEQINFSEKEKSAKKINKWISNQTNNIIKDILKANDINPLTRLMLINALHFKAPWAKPFDSDLSSKENFTLSTGKTIQLQTMHLTSYFSYYKDEASKSQWINLPYKGNNRYVLTLGLPENYTMLYKLESFKLRNSTVLSNIFNALDNSKNGNKRVQLSLPKFSIESTLDFVQYFKTYYNVTSAFDAETADFSLMSATGERGLFISKILHKSVIDVDEYGTEAAAVTVIQMLSRSRILHENPIQLSFSRPFLFYLRDTHIKIPLFVGRYTGMPLP